MFKRLSLACLTVLFLGNLVTFDAQAKRPEHHTEDKDKREGPTNDQIFQRLVSAPGVIKLKDGLAYKVIEASPNMNNDPPQEGDIAMIIYEGRLPDGTIFDESDRYNNGAYYQMPVHGLIAGWMRILPLMHPGDKWEVYVPAPLAYGHRSMGIIPADSPLVFKISLLGVDHVHNSF